MRIALDYDGTYTRDPELWNQFITAAERVGHEVICVTQRCPDEVIERAPCEVIYTGYHRKGPHMAELGRVPDVWIDDKPHRIFFT